MAPNVGIYYVTTVYRQNHAFSLIHIDQCPSLCLHRSGLSLLLHDDRTYKFLQLPLSNPLNPQLPRNNLRMLMRTRHQPAPHRPPHSLRNLPLILRFQPCHIAVFYTPGLCYELREEVHVLRCTNQHNILPMRIWERGRICLVMPPRINAQLRKNILLRPSFQLRPFLPFPRS